MSREEALEALRTVPFCRLLNDKELAEMADISEVRDYEPGNVVFYEKAPSDAVYIVLSGRLRISRTTAVR